MYEKLTLKKYLNMVADATPTPGGGSVSAYGGALASALSEMTCGIAIRKAKAKGNGVDMLRTAKKEFHKNYQRLLKLAEKDSQAYDQVFAAYQIPKYDLQRRKKINQALKSAAEVPHEVMCLCQENLSEIFRIRNLLPPQILSDISVAVLLTKAAYNGARLNVVVNVEAIKDKDLTHHLEKSMDKLEKIFTYTLSTFEDWL